MRGRSFPEHWTVARGDLRYLRLSHWTSPTSERVGEMVCNKAIADDLLYIFRQLYEAHYIIESIRLIDDYEADDEQSMRANNTSCFCFRRVAGSNKLSRHSMGMAVDINPLYNPYIVDGRILPPEGKDYVDRSQDNDKYIKKGDLLYNTFISHGWSWGGEWTHAKDYQHFDKVEKGE
jgi:hypothetical protein